MKLYKTKLSLPRKRWIRNKKVNIDPQMLITPQDFRLQAFADENKFKILKEKNWWQRIFNLEADIDWFLTVQKVWRYVVTHWGYKTDIVGMGKKDYWNFPFETLSLKNIDCEDSAILIVSILRYLGLPPQRVRCARGDYVLIKDKKPYNIGHMWAEYLDSDGVWRILEGTLIKMFDTFWLPESEVMLYLYTWGFNDKVIWKRSPSTRIRG